MPSVAMDFKIRGINGSAFKFISHRSLSFSGASTFAFAPASFPFSDPAWCVGVLSALGMYPVCLSSAEFSRRECGPSVLGLPTYYGQFS